MGALLSALHDIAFGESLGRPQRNTDTNTGFYVHPGRN
jgi:hypothetical protein